MLSLHTWAAGLGCLHTLGTLFLHGMGQDLLPGSPDAGCCNHNCGGGGERVSRIPQSNYLMEVFPRVIAASRHGFAEKVSWRAGVDGGLWDQPAAVRARSLGQCTELSPGGLSLVFCPGHSKPHIIPGPVPSVPVALWQSKFLSSLMYEWSSCFPWQPF